MIDLFCFGSDSEPSVLVSFSTLNDWSKTLSKCPCDEMSLQSTLHVDLFCKFYIVHRRMWIKPILKLWGLRQCHPAFLALQMLESECFSRPIAQFLKSTIKARKDICI